MKKGARQIIVIKVDILKRGKALSRKIVGPVPGTKVIPNKKKLTNKRACRNNKNFDEN